MTIDERLEVLAQSMEVLRGMQMENTKRFAAIMRNFEVVLESLQSLERTASARAAHLSF
jgi:hypothetical protein